MMRFEPGLCWAMTTSPATAEGSLDRPYSRNRREYIIGQAKGKRGGGARVLGRYSGRRALRKIRCLTLFGSGGCCLVRVAAASEPEERLGSLAVRAGAGDGREILSRAVAAGGGWRERSRRSSRPRMLFATSRRIDRRRSGLGSADAEREDDAPGDRSRGVRHSQKKRTRFEIDFEGFSERKQRFLT